MQCSKLLISHKLGSKCVYSTLSVSGKCTSTIHSHMADMKRTCVSQHCEYYIMPSQASFMHNDLHGAVLTSNAARTVNTCWQMNQMQPMPSMHCSPGKALREHRHLQLVMQFRRLQGSAQPFCLPSLSAAPSHIVLAQIEPVR